MKHYYSLVSGLAASLGAFFGKLITYGSSEVCFNDVSCFIVSCDCDASDAILQNFRLNFVAWFSR